MQTSSRVTQRKGDRAVAQAIATFTARGADVSIPLTESAAYDLIVDINNTIKRVQVRFSSHKEIGLRRIHSNSKGYVIKIPKKNSYDWLYVLSGQGQEFLITYELAGRNSITPQPKDLLDSVFLRWGGRVV